MLATTPFMYVHCIYIDFVLHFLQMNTVQYTNKPMDKHDQPYA